METIDPLYADVIGRHTGMAFGDKAILNIMYECSGKLIGATQVIKKTKRPTLIRTQGSILKDLIIIPQTLLKILKYPCIF